jgi:galactonate dehydratase
MRIESVDPLLFYQWLVVRIETDTGLVGYGPSAYFGYPEAAERIVNSFRGQLVGRDPLRIEHHWNRLFFWKPFRDGVLTAAIAATDIALWDIAGRHFGVPVYQLMGGKQRDAARLHLLVFDGPNATTEELVDVALDAVGEGYTALKLDALPDGVVERQETYTRTLQIIVDRVAAVREAVGWDVDLILEIHRDLSPGQIVALAGELERFRLYFLEDPVPPYSVDAHGDATSRISIPVGAGERQTTIYEFRELLARGVRFLRPDVGLSGGLTHCKKIATLASSYHAEIVAHNAFSPLLTAATLQLYAAISNCGTLEILPWEEEPPRTEMLQTPLRRDGGYMPIPEGPGLGVDLDLRIIDRYPYSPWEYPPDVRMRGDGSVFLR